MLRALGTRLSPLSGRTLASLLCVPAWLLTPPILHFALPDTGAQLWGLFRLGATTIAVLCISLVGVGLAFVPARAATAPRADRMAATIALLLNGLPWILLAIVALARGV